MRQKKADAYNDYMQNFILSNGINSVMRSSGLDPKGESDLGGQISGAGTLAGLFTGKTPTLEELDEMENDNYGWIPGNAARRLMLRRRMVNERLKGKPSTVYSEHFGKGTSGLLTSLGTAGLLALLAGGLASKHNSPDAGRLAVMGGIGGLILGGVGSALANGIGGLRAAMTPTRTDEEQQKYEQAKSHWANWLIPGVASYNHFKSLGVSNRMLKEYQDKKKKDKEEKTEKKSSFEKIAYSLVRDMYKQAGTVQSIPSQMLGRPLDPNQQRKASTLAQNEAINKNTLNNWQQSWNASNGDISLMPQYQAHARRMQGQYGKQWASLNKTPKEINDFINQDFIYKMNRVGVNSPYKNNPYAIASYQTPTTRSTAPSSPPITSKSVEAPGTAPPTASSAASTRSVSPPPTVSDREGLPGLGIPKETTEYIPNKVNTSNHLDTQGVATIPGASGVPQQNSIATTQAAKQYLREHIPVSSIRYINGGYKLDGVPIGDIPSKLNAEEKRLTEALSLINKSNGPFTDSMKQKAWDQFVSRMRDIDSKRNILGSGMSENKIRWALSHSDQNYADINTDMVPTMYWAYNYGDTEAPLEQYEDMSGNPALE